MKKERKPLTKEQKKELWRTIKFVLFSISAGVIEAVSFILLCLIPNPVFMVEKGQYPQYVWVPMSISLTLSVLWNFTFNRKYTFQSASNVPIAMLKTLGYYAIFGPLSIVFGQMYLINTLEWNEYLVKGILMVINFVTEFLYQRFFVFGKSLDTNDIAKKKQEKEELNQ